MNLSFHTPSESDMVIVKKYIAEFKLDNLEINNDQFLIAKSGGMLVGFGRLKKNNHVVELCTLGVLPDFQGNNIGRRLVIELVKHATKPIYVVCVIPAFFEKCGFKITNEYPNILNSKLNFCLDKWQDWSKHDYKILAYE